MNRNIIGVELLRHIHLVFESFGLSSDINPLNHIYLITYVSDTSDPERLISRFKYANSRLLKRIAPPREFYNYIKVQHSGVLFVDCLNSQYGYVREMFGLHIHAVVVVHPEWEERFVAAINEMERDRIQRMSISENADDNLGDHKRGFHAKKIMPTERDVFDTIRYSAKALMHDRGVYHDRNDLFELFGRNLKPRERLIPLRKNKNVKHIVKASSLTPKTEHRISI